VWRGHKSWNGVAILARDCEPVLTRTELPGDPKDKQSRYIEAAVSGVLIATLYAPNGNPQPGPKFKYKLAWMRRLLAHAAELCTLDACLWRERKRQLLIRADTAKLAATRLNQQNLPNTDIPLISADVSAQRLRQVLVHAKSVRRAAQSTEASRCRATSRR
jgi:hypothetical protein